MDEPTITAHCPVKGCPVQRGPYYSRKEADAAMTQHLLWRHPELLAPMEARTRDDARMATASRRDAGYEAPTW